MRHRVPRHSVGGPLSRSAELSRLLRIALGKPFPTHPKCARPASI
jgi:hypothetical protein